MRMRPVGVAALLACGVVLAACQPVTPAPQPPPPPPTTTPPAGGMRLGWTASGVNGPIATDPANNALWGLDKGYQKPNNARGAMNKGAQKLDELNADSGTLLQQFSVPLDSQQHFPPPQVSSGWVSIESTDKVFAHQTNGAGTWPSVVLDGVVQARPLVVGGSIVVVATEGDSLYGLNLADGTFAWSTAGNKVNIGTPEPIKIGRAHV